jgi:ubiquinone/menaquinone biosynthesis C-methylase UbiE/acyl carrier protein
MISSGSYQLSTFSTGIKAEMKRLDSQIDLFWEKERIYYEKFNMGNHLHIIDLGCGTGHLIHKLSLEYPLSKFTGVEQDPLLVQAAIGRLQNNSSVVQIINSSIEQFDSQSEKFDIAILRLVLEHVPDPLLVLNKIRSVLKPEGRIIVIDNDFEYHLSTFPQIEELKDLYKAYRESRIEDGGDPCIGRRLPDLLKQAGFSQIDLDIFTAHSQLIGDSPFLNSEGGGIPSRLAKNGFLQESVLHSLVKKWKEMLKCPHHCLVRQLFAASGVLKDSQDSDYPEEISSKSFSDQSGSGSVPSDYRKFLYDAISVSLKTDSALVDENIPLIDAGLDSVGALDVQNALKEAFNIEIPISAMLGGATPYQIAENLRHQLENRTSKNPDTSSSSDTEVLGKL